MARWFAKIVSNLACLRRSRRGTYPVSQMIYAKKAPTYLGFSFRYKNDFLPNQTRNQRLVNDARTQPNRRQY